MTSILFWIINAFIWSLSQITYKKSVASNPVSQNVFMWMWNMVYLVVGISLFFFIPTDISNTPLLILAIFLATNILASFAILIEQKLYKEEKISTLAPFNNLDSIFIIIISFIRFSGQSVVSLIMAIIAVFIITFWSLDYKKISFPKNIYLILISKVIRAIKWLSMWYVLKEILVTDAFILNNLFYVGLNIFVILFISKDFLTIKKSNPTFLKQRFTTSALGSLSSIVSLFLISNLWLIVSNLLGFLSLSVTLILSYFMFWDKPTKKTILITLRVSVCIVIWYIYK